MFGGNGGHTSSGEALAGASAHPRLLLDVLRGLRRLQIVLGLDVVQLLLLLVHVHALEGLVGLVVEHHQVAIAHVEAG